MSRRYAEGSDVPVDRSKQQIEAMLRLRGATEYATGWDAGADRIQFTMGHSTIRFVLPRVDGNDPEIKNRPDGRARPPADVQSRMAQRDRSRWRALYLVVKAKLEAVESGIAIFEQEFLAFIVMSNNHTVGDILVPRLQAGKHLQLKDLNA